MDYKIGTIEQVPLPHKYVIAREGNSLVFYASGMYRGRFDFKEVPHKEIAKKFGLENVLGGGDCYGEDEFEGGLDIKKERNTLRVGKMSTEYGATPRNVLEQFREKLLEIYQIQFPQLRISDVELTSYEIAVNLPKWEEILRLMNNV